MPVPRGVTTSIVPVAPAASIAVILFAELTVNEAAFTPPNLTAIAPVKPLPVIVTTVPAPPWFGENVPINTDDGKVMANRPRPVTTALVSVAVGFIPAIVPPEGLNTVPVFAANAVLLLAASVERVSIAAPLVYVPLTSVVCQYSVRLRLPVVESVLPATPVANASVRTIGADTPVVRLVNIKGKYNPFFATGNVY